MSLFQTGCFTSHSGLLLNWRIECDWLVQEDFDTVASIFNKDSGVEFGRVYGIPTGGRKLALALERYIVPHSQQLIIADDVVTTGGSFVEARDKLNEPDAIGLVVFCRGECPEWVFPFMRKGFWVR